MPIIKRRRSANFTTIPNEVAQDRRLAFDALGMLTYLLSQPHDWQVQIDDLKTRGNIGRDKTYLLLNDLIRVGYVVREQPVDKRGRRRQTVYVVYDTSTRAELPQAPGVFDVLPLPENPEVEPMDRRRRIFAPRPDLPDTANQDAIQKKDSYKNTPPTPPAGGAVDSRIVKEFEILAKLYPSSKIGQRLNVLRAFGALPDEDRANLLAAAPAAIAYYTRRKKGRMPALVTFVRERLYTNFIDSPPISKEGDFTITPDRPEWPAWVAHLRTLHTDTTLEQTIYRWGEWKTPDRWPPGYSEAAQ